MVKGILNKLSVLIGILFLFVIYRYWTQTDDIHLWLAAQKMGIMPIIIALISYLISHLIRGARMAVMVEREVISLRSIIKTQLYTNGINLIFPFKLGEVYRLYEFHKLIKKYQISVSTIVAEKFIDFCFLFAVLTILLFIHKGPLNLNSTIAICSVGLLLMLFICFILPGNISFFNLFIAKRYSSPSVLYILAFTNKIYTIISNTKLIFKEKISVLILLTILIWIFEISSFIFLFNSIIEAELIILLSFLVFMSVFIPAGSLGLGGIQLAFYFIYLARKDFLYMEYSLIYQIVLFLPAIILSYSMLLNKKFIEYKHNGIIDHYKKYTIEIVFIIKRKIQNGAFKMLENIYRMYRYYRYD